MCGPGLPRGIPLSRQPSSGIQAQTRRAQEYRHSRRLGRRRTRMGAVADPEGYGWVGIACRSGAYQSGSVFLGNLTKHHLTGCSGRT